MESSFSNLLNGSLEPFQFDLHLRMMLWSISDDAPLVSITCVIAASLAYLRYLGSVLPRVWLCQGLSTRVSNNVRNLLTI